MTVGAYGQPLRANYGVLILVTVTTTPEVAPNTITI